MYVIYVHNVCNHNMYTCLFTFYVLKISIKYIEQENELGPELKK